MLYCIALKTTLFHAIQTVTGTTFTQQ